MILKATSIHLPQILELNTKIIKYMKTNGYNHWTDNYPTEAIFRRDIIREAQYVFIIDKMVRGIVSFDTKHHEYFDKIDWETKGQSSYFAHRLAVDPLYQGIGIANNLMRFVENKAKEDSISSIRLGAFKGYDDVVRFYKKRGYQIRGELLFDVSEIPFYGMEKVF